MGWQLKIPRLAIPQLKISKGQLLDISIFGIGIKVPPFDITFWPEIELLPETVVFNSEWVTDTIYGMADWFGSIAAGVVDSMIPTIIQATFNAVEPYLNSLAEDFYRRRG